MTDEARPDEGLLPEPTDAVMDAEGSPDDRPEDPDAPHLADLAQGVDMPTEVVELDPTAAMPPVGDPRAADRAEADATDYSTVEMPAAADADPIYEGTIQVWIPRPDGLPPQLVAESAPAGDAEKLLYEGWIVRWDDGSTSVPEGYEGPLPPAPDAQQGVEALLDRLPDPTAPAPAPEDQEMALGEFTGAMCRAVGLDPEQVAGFRLTVQGGAYPQLEVWHLPPLGPNGEMTDRWPRAIAERMADTTIAVLPGSGGTLPPTGPRTGHLLPGHEVPPELAADHWIAAHLPMILDVLNGAPVDGDTRDQLTALGHHIAQDKARLVGSAQRPAQPPQARHGDTSGG
jgi:hypothetical protein